MTAAIGEIIRNGVLYDVKNWSDVLSEGYDFFEAVELLFEMLAEKKIRYVLVGGVALLSY